MHSFLSCVASSALVQSALLSLEVDRSHPPPAGAPAGSSAADGSLEWTLAQLMALFLRTRYARGESLFLLPLAARLAGWILHQCCFPRLQADRTPTRVPHG